MIKTKGSEIYMNLRILFLKTRLKLLPRLAGKYDFNEILRYSGIKVGDGTIFYNPNSMTIDRQRPWMLEIGEYCKITKGVIILAHDYSHSVLRRAYGDLIGEAGHTVIGNNVFIGVNSIILMGSKIGDNVIIGAGSVVSGNIPCNCVVAGNPARVIKTLEDHYEQRKQNTIHEAKEYLISFEKAYGRIPKPNEMGHFWPLFMKRDRMELKNSNINTELNGDDSDQIIDSFMRSEPVFCSYDDFVEWCKLPDE